MTDAIALLERIACMPDDLSVDQLDAATQNLEPAVRAAMLAGDVAALVGAMHGRPSMACMIMAPDEDAPEPNEAPVEDEPGVPDGTQDS